MTSTMRYHKNKTLIHLLLDKPHILDTFEMPATKESNKYELKRLENQMRNQITIVPHSYIGVLK